MFCTKCGTQLPNDSEFCHKCGAQKVRADSTQQVPDTTVTTVETIMATTAEPTPNEIPVPIHTSESSSVKYTDLNAFVDNQVRANTKFQSASDLIETSKPWMFAWIIMGASLLGIIGGPLIFLTLILGYTATFIASGIIRMQYRNKFIINCVDDFNIEELISFLDGNLQQIHPHFHEWGFLKKSGLLSIVENAIADATEEIRICSEFGPKRKNLIALYIKPKTVNAMPGEKVIFIDALKKGFLIDGRAAGFLGHSTLIKTAPIIHAAMKYYLLSKGVQNSVL